jgi:hypothetical protein
MLHSSSLQVGQLVERLRRVQRSVLSYPNPKGNHRNNFSTYSIDIISDVSLHWADCSSLWLDLLSKVFCSLPKSSINFEMFVNDNYHPLSTKQLL